MPLLINIIMLGGAFVWLFYRLGDWIPRLMAHIPDWLQWLSYLLWPLSVIAIVLVFSYFFSTLANLIAAPFCGLLAEQLEGRLTGKPLPDSGWAGMIKDVPRIMKREMQKLGYYLPRALGLLLLYFIPGFGQTVAPVLWFLFSAWMLSIQYCDYPFDNHKVPFQQMRNWPAVRCASHTRTPYALFSRAYCRAKYRYTISFLPPPGRTGMLIAFPIIHTVKDRL